MIKVLSLNLYNGKSSKNIDKLLELLSCYDEIGVQEGTYDLNKIIVKKLKDYKSYGSYRFGNIFKHLRINENNNIITKNKVLEYDTYYLSVFGTRKIDNLKQIKNLNLFSRIATVAIIKTDIGNICHINTHLSYGPNGLHKKQLDDLLEIIDMYKKYSIILTGDFNSDLDHPAFMEFMDSIKSFDMDRVNIKDYTFRDRHIDHIFVSNNLKIKEYGIISDLSDITDHNGVYVTLSK